MSSELRSALFFEGACSDSYEELEAISNGKTT
jgi:hypothetical protein